jgi:uncharacterized membrane protein
MEILMAQVLKSLPPEIIETISNIGQIAMQAQQTLKNIEAQNATIIRHLGIVQDETNGGQSDQTKPN